MKKLLVITMLLGFGVSCSSVRTTEQRDLEEKEHDDLKKDYLVRDSSSPMRPGWVEDAEVWANNKKLDIGTYRYFSYETDPSVSRKMSCNQAKANARADIAGEIATFIDKSLASSEEGANAIDENNPQTKGLRQFVSNTLAEKVQAIMHGVSVRKTYWEKRKYKKKMGAKRDFTAFTCAVFLRVPTERLTRAIDEAANHVANAADDPETKANVKNALQDASKNFVKAKQGQL
ncbi:MAG: hypothetical protein HN509_14815 [Halobacteriovoraceae bacterium]|jgi:hypothetical protein|nr:hypothetical protein [Halobacteriovoraceae bacterium]MBT5095645.1 hypothetical protein [Halobacteriovoraceae bacterium]